MAKVELTVEPKSKSEVGWFVHLFSWDAQQKNVVVHRLNKTSGSEGDEKYVLQSEADLPAGVLGLRLHLVGAGTEVSVTATGKPAVAYPTNSTWPMKVKVPSVFTQGGETWFFTHGGAA